MFTVLKMCGMFFILLISYYMTGSLVSASCFQMIPRGDVLKRRGEDLQVSCSILAGDDGKSCSDKNIYDISFKMVSKQVSPRLLVFNETEKKVVTTIRNLTISDSGWFECLYRDTTKASLRVHVRELPEAPENLTCVSHDWNDLSCSFNLSEKRENIYNEWRMEYRRYSQKWTYITKETNCDSDKNRCWLDSRMEAATVFTFMRGARYDVRVVVRNGLGNATTSVTLKNTASIVKLSPMETLGYDEDRRNGTLRWRCPRSLSLYGQTLDYKIVVTSSWNARVFLIRNRTTSAQEYVLQGLIPFTNYTATVQARLSASVLDLYWSDPSTFDFETPSAIPEHAVTMATGSYMLLDCGHREMCLVIYWKSPEKRYWYGNITGYKVTVREFVTCAGTQFDLLLESEPKRDEQSEVIDGLAVFGLLQTKLLKKENYKMQLKMINDAGVSENKSEILIPNWSVGQALKLEWVDTVMNKDNVFVSWIMAPRHCSAVTSVTYYWCFSDNESTFDASYISCKGVFDWTKFNLTDGCGTDIGHNISIPVDLQDLKFAVSVATNLVSGGLVWEKIRFKKGAVPVTPFYSVRTDGTAVSVHIHYWVSHYSQWGKPVNHSIMYAECTESSDCLTDNFSGTNKTFSVDFLKPDYTIYDLKPGTKYKIRVASLNRFGSSEYGEPLTVSLAKDLNEADVVIGTLTGVVALAVILMCCLGRRWIKKTRKKIEIRIPEATLMMPGDGIGKEIIKMEVNDHDSGKGSDSLVSESINDLQKDGSSENLPRTPSSDFAPSPTFSDSLLNIDGDCNKCPDAENITGYIKKARKALGQNGNSDYQGKEKAFKSMDGNFSISLPSNENLNQYSPLMNVNDVDESDKFESGDIEYQLAHEISSNKHATFDVIENTYIPNDNEKEMARLFPPQTKQKTNINLDYVEATHDVVP